ARCARSALDDVERRLVRRQEERTAIRDRRPLPGQRLGRLLEPRRDGAELGVSSLRRVDLDRVALHGVNGRTPPPAAECGNPNTLRTAVPLVRKIAGRIRAGD